MPQQHFGHIIVAGSAADLALAATAYAGQVQPKRVEDLLTSDFHFEVHSTPDFRAHKPPLLVPGSVTKATPAGRVAFGYTLDDGTRWINNSKSQKDQVYAYRHEPFHSLFADNISQAKAADLKKLVERVTGGTAYQNRLSEVWCDAMVELFWKQGSILDDFYGDIADADLQHAFDIVMATEAAPTPIPVEPPAPLPMPDPAVAELQADNTAKVAQIADLTSQLSAANAAKATLQSDRDTLLDMRQADVADAQRIVSRQAPS